MNRRVKSSTFAPNLNATVLTLDNGATEYAHVAGAIVWPQYLSIGDVMPGAVVVGCHSIDDNILRVRDEMQFNSLTPDMENGKIKDGLCYFLDRAKKLYNCTSFFWAGDKDLHRRYRLQMSRNGLYSDFNTMFIRAPYADNQSECNNLIMQYNADGLFQIVPDGEIHRQLKMNSDNPVNQNFIQALRVLLAGFERLPWQAPYEMEIFDMYDHRFGWHEPKPPKQVVC